jgi:hypothetical protein
VTLLLVVVVLLVAVAGILWLTAPSPRRVQKLLAAQRYEAAQRVALALLLQKPAKEAEARSGLVRAYAGLKQRGKAAEQYRRLVGLGKRVDKGTITALLEAAGRAELLDQAGPGLGVRGVGSGQVGLPFPPASTVPPEVERHFLSDPTVRLGVGDTGIELSRHGSVSVLQSPQGEIRFLWTLVGDLPSDVRGPLVAYLAGLQTHDNTVVRVRAALCLVALGDARGLPVVRERLHSRDALVRREAVETLSLCSLPEATALLRAAARDPRPGIRRDATAALNPRCDAGSFPVFRDGLRDEDAEVRAESALALGALGDARARPLLAKRLDDPSADAQLAVFAALWQLEEAAPPQDATSPR